MKFIAIVGLSTFISMAAYMIQHGSFYTPKDILDLTEKAQLKAESYPIDISLC